MPLDLGGLTPGERRRRRVSQRVLDALYYMRSQGLSLGRAARAAHTDPRTVHRHAGRVLTMTPEGQYRAKADRLRRAMVVFTTEGVVVGDVRGSAAGSLVAAHWAAVKHYYRSGDASRLTQFRGRRIRVDGQPMEFMTDPDDLRRHQLAGEVVSFEELYALRA